MADSPVADYQVKQSNGQFKLVGKPYGTAPYGIAIPKDSGLAQAACSRRAEGADGRRRRTRRSSTKWGVAVRRDHEPGQINGATS